ncbi:MAG: PD-(D/E)XK nuclease family protein, partial [Candidatus Cloacimonetes bacterium]|nr:PD-(D/E)XK nuclease family protein [Candidatus Cloacimonadota bacterium]
SQEKSLISPYPDYLSLREQNQLLDEQDFFIIPCEPKQDFGKDLTLNCSYYNLQQLFENPFVWFIQCLQKLSEIDFRPQDKVSEMMVGSLVHRFISDLLSPLNGKRCSLEELESVLNQRESSLSAEFNDLLSSDDFLFLLPQNHSLQFIRDIYSSHLAQSIKSFYRDFFFPKVENNNFTLYVETGKYEENLTKENPLPLESESKENQVQVILRGRSDLRIEAANQKIIVDFKTGRNPNRNQLYFYEWLYYRYIQEDMDIFSTFWIISDNETKYKSSKDSALKWRNKVYTTLANCMAEGYTLGRTLGQLKQLKRITRADLYRPNKGVNNE